MDRGKPFMPESMLWSISLFWINHKTFVQEIDHLFIFTVLESLFKAETLMRPGKTRFLRGYYPIIPMKELVPLFSIMYHVMRDSPNYQCEKF